MNNDKTTPDADDQDLTRLFDAQQEQVPEALDALILSAAKEAVTQPAAGPKKRRGTAFRSWFAVAATLLLGITITPLLLQAPDSSLDRTASTGSTLKAVGESLSMNAEPALFELQDSDSATAGFASRDEAPMPITGPILPAIKSQKRAAVTSSSALAQPQRATDGGEYRRTPESWLKRIRTLMEEKQPLLARTEYELFRKRFPNFAPDFAPDFTLRAEPE